MKRIYDWDAKFCLRNYTTADLLALKGARKLTQTTANSEEEAAAAADAGIDLIMGNAVNAEAGAPVAVGVAERLGRRLGGHTGDSYGAVVVVTEAITLLLLAGLAAAN